MPSCAYRLGDRLIKLMLVDHSASQHLRQHMIAPRFGASWISIRPQTIGRLRQTSQQRRLRKTQIRARPSEVAPACRAGADEVAAEGGAVEILDQDLLLGLNPLDLLGANGLLDLVPESPPARLAQAMKLHRQRACAAMDAK